MYVNIECDRECSKCGAINEDKLYWKYNTQYRECDICKHKVEIAKLTTTKTEGTITYDVSNKKPIKY